MADLSSAGYDVVIVGAGAAGLATAIFTKRLNPDCRIAVLEGAAKPGAKILVSGGSRCNVTNRLVSERDFWGGRSTIVRRVLRALSVQDTVRFFEDLGVRLHEEADGKLFPDSNRARDVLNALTHATTTSGAILLTGQRVRALRRTDRGFAIESSTGALHARDVVLATGGQSLPKSGSDGAGFAMARGLGHTIVPTTPGLVPLMLDGADDLHRELAGVAQDVELTVWVRGAISVRLSGALLWTHFGLSGPVALNASRHILRAELEGDSVSVTLSFCPGRSFEAVDAEWQRTALERPKVTVQNALAAMVPASVAAALLRRLKIVSADSLAYLTREHRRLLVRALTEWRLNISGDRGYNYAEVTAGGVDLAEIDPSTMQSRVSPGLFLVGEILDVDGRIGGFNFQWAWSSARAAAGALAARSTRPRL